MSVTYKGVASRRRVGRVASVNLLFLGNILSHLQNDVD